MYVAIVQYIVVQITVVYDRKIYGRRIRELKRLYTLKQTCPLGLSVNEHSGYIFSGG